MIREVQWIVCGIFTVLILGVSCAEPPVQQDYPIQPVSFESVRLDDDFWSPRLKTNRDVTIPQDLKKLDEKGRIRNFLKAAGQMEGNEFEGEFSFNDSDIFKVIEGASNSLVLFPDPDLARQLDDFIDIIASVQDDDGYLFTPARLVHPVKTIQFNNLKTRWKELRWSHELYNLGHMYEAAAAHYRATGKRNFLNIAIKSADFICDEFGPEALQTVPGHQEVELGLVQLFRVTDQQKYLELAKYFLDERGHANGRELGGAYNQDHKPVIEQYTAVGHAVRACYMYAGMTDVAALTGDEEYIKALDAIWEDVVSGKQSLTGGVGARRKGESFGDPYELPNRDVYNETCAAIANAMWNYRMFLYHGDAKFIDVLERVIYNGFLAGISLDGQLFFYPNPLAADGKYTFNKGSAERVDWWKCSCCMTNVVRFLPEILGYMYAVENDNVYINLFAGGESTVEVEGNSVRIRQETRYPWNGNVRMTITPERTGDFTLCVRIPGWSQNQPMPSDLYRYQTADAGTVMMFVNGDAVPLDLKKGYARINRQWESGDVVELKIPMLVRRVLSHDNLAENRGRIAIERGPLVYCVEGIDNGGSVSQLTLPDAMELIASFDADLLGGLTVIKGENFRAIPYYAWAHRGIGEMTVWMPKE